MARLFARVNLAILSIAVALHAFDVRLFYIRLNSPVQADSLLHYNLLLAWWRHGDSPRGFTLTPSPYLIDMVVQLPIMLLAPDFERFSYGLACAYAILIFASLYLVVRVAIDTGTALAIVVTGITVVGFYELAPFNFVVHAFVVNHTSEVFTTLGLLALLHLWFRPGARRRRYAPYVYALAVALCVTSSPFFIATYCIPAAVGATAILGTEYVTRRRLAWFLGLTGIGALVGLSFIAFLSHYVWPVRGDYYGGWWRSYLAFKRTVVSEPGGIRVAWATVIAMIASTALAIVGRRTRQLSIPTTFMLAFFPASVIACVGLPIKRGAFDGGYAFRYVLLPWLLMVGFYVAAGARIARVLVAAALRRGPLPALPSWLSWTTGMLGIAGLALLATFRGSFTMDDDASRTSPTIRCFRDAEKSAGLQDGLANWWLARYLNAARHASAWKSPHVVVQMLLNNNPPAVDPRDNNLLWFDGTYRGGTSKLNFVATHLMTEEQLQFFRDRIGPPERTVTCPPSGWGVDNNPYELWIWYRGDAQQRLADLVTHDNVRSPFSPVIGATSMVIDPVWGMYAEPTMGELVGRRRSWRRGVHGSRFLEINAMLLPSGKYRLDLKFTSVPTPGSTGPVAELRLYQDRVKGHVRFPIAAGPDPAIEFEIENRGGPTSGTAISFDMVAGAAESIEISGATLTLVERRGISPFGIFR